MFTNFLRRFQISAPSQAVPALSPCCKPYLESVSLILSTGEYQLRDLVILKDTYHEAPVMSTQSNVVVNVRCKLGKAADLPNDRPISTINIYGK